MTDLEQAYQDVAERSLEAADAAFDRGLFETTAFQSYHAFESIGGAFCHSYGKPYPRAHIRKLNQFVATSKGSNIGRGVAALAGTLGSLRNLCLYPDVGPNGQINRPSDLISAHTAKDLRSRVGGLVGKVKRLI